MRKPRQPAVYIMASKKNGTLYIGVTSDITKRIYEHKNLLVDGFSQKYGCKILVFFELHSTMEEAIAREKYIKGLVRKRKLAMIETNNPDWRDLYDEIAVCN